MFGRFTILFSLLLAGCNLGGGGADGLYGSNANSSGTSNFTTPQAPTASTPTPTTPASPSSIPNVLQVTLGGTSLCGSNINEPCVSVTICVPGTSQCEIISDILVDTGSYGLRIFSQAVTLSLPAVSDSSGKPIAECAQFGTGTDWGPVVTAGVQLGSEPVVNVPIQVINSAFASIPTGSGCTTPDTGPAAAGFNGILGVGLFAHDCGSACVTNSSNGVYYSCSGTSCTGTTVGISSQVQNPVALLPVDNNGVVLDLPAIGANGSNLVSGQLILGIGTQSNNTPSGVTLYRADTSGNFVTKFNSTTYAQSFIDSGSNGFFFPGTSSLPNCSSTSSAPGWFCPATTQSLSATNTGSNGTPSGSVSFQVANASNLVSTGNAVFNDIGADLSASGFTASFDWGLPFFLGRKVYVGIEAAHSSLGTGPYWAY